MISSKRLVYLCNKYLQITGEIALKKEEFIQIELSLRHLRDSERGQQQEIAGCVSIVNQTKVVRISKTQVMIVQRINDDSCKINVEKVVCAD